MELEEALKILRDDNKTYQLNKLLNDTLNIESPKYYQAIETVIEYIKQLETEKYNLINKLERANEIDTESVKRFEEMRRKTKDRFYKKSYQTSIHQLNTKREVRKSIILVLKGENNE